MLVCIIRYACCIVFDHREKVGLVDDISKKQQLLQERQGELESLHMGVNSATEQRDKLEKERMEARAMVDHLNAEVRGGCRKRGVA